MKDNGKIQILFLGQLPESCSPSQRFRIEQYYRYLPKDRFEIFFQPFITKRYSPFIYKKGFFLKKIRGIVIGFLNRCKGLFIYRDVDFVFVQREASLIGPPIFEWIYSTVLGKKLIYDFDDAIWIPDVSSHNKLATSVKAFWKVKYICKWSYKVSVGNHYLTSWASQFNSQVIYNPTCVDMVARYNVVKSQEKGKVVIGWTGSHSTLKYLSVIKPVMEELEAKHDFEFLVICDKEPDWEIRCLRFIPWKEESEIGDLLKMNIGIMPLQQDEWSEGKCGFKLIQYLALGIPAVASPVGVNKQIIEVGKNGFLCETEAEWKMALEKLLQHASLRQAMGLAGREKMFKEFSTQSNADNFVSLFS